MLSVFQCGRCNIAFELAVELKRHMTATHVSKPKAVKQRLPKEKKEKIRGRKRKKLEKTYQCYLCRTNFSTTEEIRVHMKRHERDQKCEICKMELTFVELNSHLCGERRSIRCDYCATEFTATLKLIDHLEESHEKGLSFHQCERCPKYFAMLALKEFHMASHDGQSKQFVCNVCSKTFSTKILLKTHSKRHEETECKRFVSKASL